MRTITLLAAAALLAGCVATHESGPGGGPALRHEKAVPAAAQVFELSKSPTPDEVEAFQNHVSQSYARAVVEMSHENFSEFTYSLTPAGSINPFSSAEIQCIISESAARGGRTGVCRAFFGYIAEKYRTLR